MSSQAGLRELKKAQTRQAIAGAAARLFAERGFEQTTVEDIARAAQVTKKTVFNHFPAKEDLVFDRAAERERELVAAVRDRAAGTSVLEAFRAICHQQASDLPRLRRHVQSGRGFLALLSSSPALQRRMTEHNEQLVAALAGQLRTETQASEGDPWPDVAACALVGAQTILFRRLRELVAADLPLSQVAGQLALETNRVFDYLSGGFAI